MIAGLSARRPSSFATGLALAGVGAATITALGQAAVIDRLTSRAVVTAALERARHEVACLSPEALAQAPSPDGAGPVGRRPEAGTGRAEGDLALLGIEGHAGIRSARWAPASVDAASVRPSGQHLLVTVPVGAGPEMPAVQLEMDAQPFLADAARLRDRVHAALLLGVLALAPITLAIGGRPLRRRYRELMEAARLDVPTGLGNRNAFTGDLARHATSATRRGQPLALALVDVNGLDAARDAAGRRGADALLARVAAVLRGGRTGQRAYRVAGDGFAVILPRTTDRQAQELSRSWPARIAGTAEPLTADVGVSSLGEHTPDAETLLIAAETRLADERERRVQRDHAAAEPDWDVSWLGPGRRPG